MAKYNTMTTERRDRNDPEKISYDPHNQTESSMIRQDQLLCVNVDVLTYLVVLEVYLKLRLCQAHVHKTKAFLFSLLVQILSPPPPPVQSVRGHLLIRGPLLCLTTNSAARTAYLSTGATDTRSRSTLRSLYNSVRVS